MFTLVYRALNKLLCSFFFFVSCEGDECHVGAAICFFPLMVVSDSGCLGNIWIGSYFQFGFIQAP